MHVGDTFTHDAWTAESPEDADRGAMEAMTPPAAPARSREWSSAHPINLRLSLPLVFGRYYVTIVAGRERRSAARLAEERKKHPVATAGNLLFLVTIGTVAGLAFLSVIQAAIRLLFATG